MPQQDCGRNGPLSANRHDCVDFHRRAERQDGHTDRAAGMATGFAGIDNPLFVNPKTVMLFGDAKESMVKLIEDVKDL